MKSRSGTINLDELPILKQEHLVSLIRHFRAVITARHMYPIGHQMIERSIERLHQFILDILKNSPRLVLDCTSDTLEFNGEKLTLPVPEREHATQLAPMLKRKGLQTLVFVRQTTKSDMVNLFNELFKTDEEQESFVTSDQLQMSIPSLVLNPTIVRRKQSEKVRDKLSIEEVMSAMDKESLLRELGLDPNNLPPEVEEQLKKAEDNKAKEETIQDDPKSVLNALPEYVRNGQFMQQLLELSPTADIWPTYWKQQAKQTQREERNFTPSSSLLDAIPHDYNLTPSQSKAPTGLEQIDLQSFKNRPATDFPPHLQPDQLVESEQFESWLNSGKFDQYLDTYFARQNKLNQRLQFGDPEAEKDLNSPFARQQIQTTMQRLSQSLYNITDPANAEKLLHLFSNHLKEMVPELLNQYIFNLSSKDPTQRRLRKSILDAINKEKLADAQDELIKQIETGIPDKAEAAPVVELLEEIVEKQLSEGQLRKVNNVIQQLEKKQTADLSNELLQESTQKLLGHLANDKNITQLFRQGLQQSGKDARKLLAQIAPQSLKKCVSEVLEENNPQDKRRQIELLVDILKETSEEKKEAGFAPLIEQLDNPNTTPEEQVLLLELGRRHAPTHFEKHIIKNLSSTQSPEQRTQLLRQAIAHNTPNLRKLFQNFIDKRTFASNPEQEELILQYLNQIGAIDIGLQLSLWIHDQDQNIGLRHSAIWMLGAFRDQSSLRILGELLFNKKEELKQKNTPFYEEDIRFQALHTLTRFSRIDVIRLIKQAQKDPSILVSSYAERLLESLEVDGKLPSEVEIHSLETQVNATPELLLELNAHHNETTPQWLQKVKEKITSLFH